MIGVPAPSLFLREIERTFYRVAQEARERGLLPPGAQAVLMRHIERKPTIWCRHLRDLCSYIERKEQEHEHEKVPLGA